MKLKDIKRKLAACRKAIEQDQHPEYIEAYLCAINQALTAGLKNGKLKLKGKDDFTEEEWQEMVRVEQEDRERLKRERS